MYVSLAKNACTSLKWMMAEIAGEDLESFTPGLSPYVNDIEAIHDRRQWRRAVALGQLPQGVRAGIRPDNGWFIFTAVRDPRSRCFSAWQNKMLLDSPGYTKWRQEPWHPRFPTDRDQIAEDFASFVDLLLANPEHPLMTDSHFRTQTRLLRRDVVDYSRIYEIHELGELRRDLAAHLESTGWSGELVLRRDNDTPLRATARMFEGGVREKLEQIYATDFRRYGKFWDFAAIEAAAEWSDAALLEAQRQATSGHRIGDLRDFALASQRDVRRLASRVSKFEAVPTASIPTFRVVPRLPRLRRVAGRLRNALLGGRRPGRSR